VKARDFIVRHNILGQILVLAITLSSFSIYNYISQKHVFLEQMQTDTANIVEAVRSSINKFRAIKATMSLQELVQGISLKLEIFEFRYLGPDGTIINSMFRDEIGRKFVRPGFDPAKIGRGSVGHVYFDARDYTKVMAVSHPVYLDDEVVGIIDLAVDISEYDRASKTVRNLALKQMRAGVRNLINAIEGSVVTSLKVFRTVDYFDFLSSYIQSSRNILQVAILNQKGNVEVSSDPKMTGQHIAIIDGEDRNSTMVRENGVPVFRVVAPLDPKMSSDKRLYLLIDASPYAANERRLFLTALGTSSLAILFSVLIAYTIYRVNIERARQENIRLEETVRERTAEIERLSQTDALTGLANRRHFDEMLESEFRRSLRYGHELSLLVVDLDHFKKINDTHGHLGGDAVLRAVGRVLREKVRETDFVGRFGGEEFIVILPESGPVVALKLAENIRAALESEAVIFEDKVIPVTASIGISTLRDDIIDSDTLLHEADVALYSSKENGRNRVTYLGA
jgi:diguanylate cyclase (GGDEF)-like protein